jgi:NTE family protein
MTRNRIVAKGWPAVLLALLLAACAAVPIDSKLAPPSYAESRLSNNDRPVIGLVLGSGASRGFAHIGVIQALEANGIVPDVIVGASSGSLVGALYAGGYDGRALEKIALEMDESDVRDFMFPDRGFVRGRALQDYVNRHLGNRSIEQLEKPFAAVATDLNEGHPVVFNRGNTGIAVRASSSIPGLFQPVRIGNRDYVDGGLLSPVPIKTARKLGADIVIAVDVSRKPDEESLFDSIISILDQTIAIVSRFVAAGEVSEADVLIQPDVGELGRFDFEHATKAIAQGRTAAEGAMARIFDAIRSKLTR